MPFIAKLIARQGIARTSVHFSTGDDGRGSSAKEPDMKARTGLTDDLGLRRADSSVLAMRRSELGYNQMSSFASVTRHGLPIVGFRNSLQAFGFPGDGEGAKWWNDAFPVETWGSSLNRRENAAVVWFKAWALSSHRAGSRQSPAVAGVSDHRPPSAALSIPKPNLGVRAQPSLFLSGQRAQPSRNLALSG